MAIILYLRFLFFFSVNLWHFVSGGEEGGGRARAYLFLKYYLCFWSICVRRFLFLFFFQALDSARDVSGVAVVE